MNITLLKKRLLETDSSLYHKYMQLNKYLIELNKKSIPNEIIIQINNDIDELNGLNNSNQLQKVLKQKQTKIVSLVEKELKIVPVNYYRNLWITLGMSVFGIPLGVLFGTMINFALFALGLPVGVAIGVIVGMQLDKKALKENRQLNLEMKN